MKNTKLLKIIFSTILILLVVFSVQVSATDSNNLNNLNSEDIVASSETHYQFASSALLFCCSNIAMS